MKKENSIKTWYDDAKLEVLLSYEAYCLGTGCTDKTFKEVLNSKSDKKLLYRYFNLLQNAGCETGVDTTGKYAQRLLNIISYIPTCSHFAYAFVTLNRYLLKYHNSVCLLSKIDIQTIISILNNSREYVCKITNGDIRYREVGGAHISTVNTILEKSMTTVDCANDWIDFECPLHHIALWLVSDWYNDGAASDTVTVSSDVLLSLLNRRNPANNKYVPVDNAEAVMMSLPAFGGPYISFYGEEACVNISRFVYNHTGDCGYSGSHINLAYDESARAIIFNGIHIMARRRSTDDMIVVSVGLKDRSYTLNISKDSLKNCRGYFTESIKDIKKFGDGINMSISSNNTAINNVICQLPNEFRTVSSKILYGDLEVG